MDRKTLYEKAEKAINHAFELTKQTVKIMSEKAGEAAHITGLLIEKVTLEHRVSKKFSELGNAVYEKILREGKAVLGQDPEIKKLIEETQKLDVELSQVEVALQKERQGRGAAK